MALFAKEKLLQHFVLGYRLDLYFPDHKLATEIDEKGNKDRCTQRNQKTKSNR